MPKPETNRRRVVDRLNAEGWVNEGGKEHDLYRRPSSGSVIVVPRHRELSPGVARQIGKSAGWL
jgi:predicted RNA binding protein YcfA (HicA-like mRNA interferase family)